MSPATVSDSAATGSPSTFSIQAVPRDEVETLLEDGVLAEAMDVI